MGHPHAASQVKGLAMQESNDFNEILKVRALETRPILL
jgi:hypothetical protein